MMEISIDIDTLTTHTGTQIRVPMARAVIMGVAFRHTLSRFA